MLTSYKIAEADRRTILNKKDVVIATLFSTSI